MKILLPLLFFVLSLFSQNTVTVQLDTFSRPMPLIGFNTNAHHTIASWKIPAFRESTALTIGFSIQESGFVSLKVFDALGREVATVMNNEMTSGEYSIPFDAATLSSGVYLYRLQSGQSVETKRMVLLK